MSVRAVIFDRDGVLTTVDEVRLARELLAHVPVSREQLAVRWQAWLAGRALVEAADEHLALREFLLATADALGLTAEARRRVAELDYAAYVRAWPDAAPALRWARAAGLRVGVLTNNSAGLSPRRMLALAGLDELVDVAVSSQMLGARKPALAAYLGAAAALDVAPEQCLFLDDAPACVAGARAAGMRAYLVARGQTGDRGEDTLADLSGLAALVDPL